MLFCNSKFRSYDTSTILARTKHPRYDLDGIEVMDIARWLKG